MALNTTITNTYDSLTTKAAQSVLLPQFWAGSWVPGNFGNYALQNYITVNSNPEFARMGDKLTMSVQEDVDLTDAAPNWVPGTSKTTLAADFKSLVLELDKSKANTLKLNAQEYSLPAADLYLQGRNTLGKKLMVALNVDIWSAISGATGTNLDTNEVTLAADNKVTVAEVVKAVTNLKKSGVDTSEPLYLLLNHTAAEALAADAKIIQADQGGAGGERTLRTGNFPMIFGTTIPVISSAIPESTGTTDDLIGCVLPRSAIVAALRTYRPVSQIVGSAANSMVSMVGNIPVLTDVWADPDKGVLNVSQTILYGVKRVDENRIAALRNP